MLFSEEQIYRIDHYLGKETVQNMLAFRFANGIFEPLWNRNYIHHVEVTSVEHIGVGNRGGYYDGAGALRDMVQNHLLQLVGMVAMEPPPASGDHFWLSNPAGSAFLGGAWSSFLASPDPSPPSGRRISHRSSSRRAWRSTP